MSKEVILTIKNLVVKFKMHNKILTTIRNVSLNLYSEETLAIVGESGSGKSVLTKVLTDMIGKNGWVSQGQVIYYPSANAINDELAYFKKPVHIMDFHKILLDKQLRKSIIKKNRQLIKAKQAQKNLLATITKKTVADKIKMLKMKIKTYQDQIIFGQEKPRIANKIATLQQQLQIAKDYQKLLTDKIKKAAVIDTLTTEITNLMIENKKISNFSCKEKLILNKNMKMLQQFYENDIKPLPSAFAKIEKFLQKQQYQSGFGYRIQKFNDAMIKNRKDETGFASLIEEWNLNKSFNFINKKKANVNINKLRGHTFSTIFQDPMTSLNPLLSVGFQISETLRKNQRMSRKEAKKAAISLLEKVGISNAEKRYYDIPSMYSGGMRQRVVIAIALACKPQILICDEPTTALDVTIQTQIIDLIKTLQKEYRFAIIFITHDLGLVANIADRVAVLYAGQIVEYGLVEEIFYRSQHPYTWALLSSLPQFSKKGQELFSIPGNPPSLANQIQGDAFAPRNDYALAVDYQYEPPLFKISETHYAKTWLLDKRAPKINRPKVLDMIKEFGGN